MAYNVDELALSCNILLKKLFFLCSNSLITKEQLLENSRLKAKFLVDNLENIESLEIKEEAIVNLNKLLTFLPIDEIEDLFYNN